MLSGLKIKGFRGITDCEIKGLKTINAFIGRNNHGKSSILEALYLASAGFSFKHPFGYEPNKIRYLLNRRSRRGLSWEKGRETLWYRYETHNPLKIEVVPRKRGKLVVELLDEHVHPLVRIPRTKRAYRHFMNLKELPADARKDICIYGRLCLIEGHVFKGDMSAYGLGKRRILNILGRTVPHFHETKAFMDRMMFIDANLLREMERVEKTLWNDLLKERSDKLVTKILRRGYEVDVEDITYVPIDDTYQLAVKLPETTIRVDDLGDGARYSMIWIMVAALAHNTAILIEEPESHQHPGGLAKTLEMLFDITKRNKIQLFATTHSLEFIKLAEKIAEEEKIDMATFFIEMDKNGKIEPRSITPKDSDNLEKMGLDMRFLDVI